MSWRAAPQRPTRIQPIVVSPSEDPTETYVEFEAGAPGRGIGGETQDRSLAYRRFRLQRLEFRIAGEICSQLSKPWLFPRILGIVHEVVTTKVEYADGVERAELGNLRYVTELRERTYDALQPGAEGKKLVPVLNEYDPIGSTDCDFQTVKDCEATVKSHISHAVCDSGLEREIVQVLEEDDRVIAYAKERPPLVRHPLSLSRPDWPLPSRLHRQARRGLHPADRGQGPEARARRRQARSGEALGRCRE